MKPVVRSLLVCRTARKEEPIGWTLEGVCELFLVGPTTQLQAFVVVERDPEEEAEHSLALRIEWNGITLAHTPTAVVKPAVSAVASNIVTPIPIPTPPGGWKSAIFTVAVDIDGSPAAVVSLHVGLAQEVLGGPELTRH